MSDNSPPSQIAEGDVVELRSGGPSMSVQAVEEDGSVSTMWFDDNGTLRTGTFPISTLRQVDEPSL